MINGKKVTPWIYHVDCQFVGDIPEELWCEYPETTNFSYGSGEKINDTLYPFRADGEDVIGLTTEEILTMYEELILIQHYEDISITDWKVEFIGEYEEKISLFLTLPEGKTLSCNDGVIWNSCLIWHIQSNFCPMTSLHIAVFSEFCLFFVPKKIA